MTIFKRFLVVLFTMFWVPFVNASLLEGSKKVVLKPMSGEAVTIATVDFIKQKDGSYTYTLEMVDELYSDHFLSMRPFQCFTTPSQMLCHLGYPYPKTTKITSADLQDLEYDLLFIHRKGEEYGIDPWNGLYYKLTLLEDGTLTGVLMEVDLDILAVPPEKGVTRPIVASDLNKAEPSSHSYPTLIIK